MKNFKVGQKVRDVESGGLATVISVDNAMEIIGVKWSDGGHGTWSMNDFEVINFNENSSDEAIFEKDLISTKSFNRTLMDLIANQKGVDDVRINTDKSFTVAFDNRQFFHVSVERG